MVSWEGLIVEMTLTLDGITHRRTLDREWWHNYVAVNYRNAGAATVTAVAQDADSVDEYGRMEYADTIGESTAAAAVALRDQHLADFALPRSRITGLELLRGETKQDTLQVSVAGYVASLGWRQYSTTLEAVTATSAVTTLVGASEFIVAGMIDTNSLSMDVDCDPPQRLWDAIEGVMDLGDASGNPWVGGVYSGRRFNYAVAASAVDYRIRNGRLVAVGDTPTIPPLVLPNIIVRVANALASYESLSSRVWDDPRNTWITEVEFADPDVLVLKPAGFEDVMVLREQLT